LKRATEAHLVTGTMELLNRGRLCGVVQPPKSVFAVRRSSKKEQSFFGCANWIAILHRGGTRWTQEVMGQKTGVPVGFCVLVAKRKESANRRETKGRCSMADTSLSGGGWYLLPKKRCKGTTVSGKQKRGGQKSQIRRARSVNWKELALRDGPYFLWDLPLQASFE